MKTVEEKAKAYDEALERAKKLQETCDSTTVVGWCEYIFQELRESKDEKIKKEIINYFAKGKEYLSLCSIGKDDILAWLEKQAEQKHTAEEVLIKAGLKPYKDGDQWCVLLGDNIQEGICGFGNTIEDALYAFLKDLIASRGEQKPAWSEEDEKIFNKIIRKLDESDNVSHYDYADFEMWLIDLKEKLINI